MGCGYVVTVWVKDVRVEIDMFGPHGGEGKGRYGGHEHIW